MATDYRGVSIAHRMENREHYRIVLAHPALSFFHELQGQWGPILDWIDRAAWVVPLNRTPPTPDATTAVLDVVVYPGGVGRTVAELVSGIVGAATDWTGMAQYVTVLSVELLTGSAIKDTGATSGDQSRADAAAGAESERQSQDSFLSLVGGVKTTVVVLLVLVALLAVVKGGAELKQWV